MLDDLEADRSGATGMEVSPLESSVSAPSSVSTSERAEVELWAPVASVCREREVEPWWVPAYSTMPSDQIVHILGARGYIW
jgi:hypothetical protein